MISIVSIASKTLPSQDKKPEIIEPIVVNTGERIGKSAEGIMTKIISAKVKTVKVIIFSLLKNILDIIISHMKFLSRQNICRILSKNGCGSPI